MEMKKLYRSTTDKRIAGVCGGVAEYFGVDSTLIRLLVALCVLVLGTGVLAYILAWLIIPQRPDFNNYNNYYDYNNPNNYNNYNNPNNGGNQ